MKLLATILTLVFGCLTLTAQNINFSNTTPAAPSGSINALWQQSGAGSGTVSMSAYFTDLVLGASSSPTATCSAAQNAYLFYAGPLSMTTTTALYLCDNGSSGWAWYQVGGSTSSGGSGTVNACSTVGAVSYYNAAGSAVVCDSSFTTDGNGNVRANSITMSNGATKMGFNPTTVAALPHPPPTGVQFMLVSDAATPCDSSTGGGVTSVWEYWTGSAWASADELCSGSLLTFAGITPSTNAQSLLTMTYSQMATALGVTSGTGQTTQTIAYGTATLGTAAITVGNCATVVTGTATGGTLASVLATDNLQADFSGDPSTITGYGPTGGGLEVTKWALAGAVNFHVCNSQYNPAGTVTPGAATIYWRVTR